MQDPISDMLTRIRNGQRSQKKMVQVPSSRLKIGIAKVLLDEGYLESYQVDTQDLKKPVLKLFLKYFQGRAVIEMIQRVSKPSRRVYTGWKNIPAVLNGLGISILSTSHGVVSHRQSKELRLGGEVICYLA